MAQAVVDNERYEVLEVIGRGAFGIIRKVRRKQDGQILCRKEINYLKMSSKERDQLQAEFSILSSLRNGHIVQYYHREHIKQTQELYMYMEYCGGGDLGTIIRELKKTNKFAKEDFVWRMFSQILAALYRCHYGIDPLEPGESAKPPESPLGLNRTNPMILHRDLKPENIFLDGEKSVKLGDFGLSKIMQSHDFASTYVGTPFYMSPEICAGERYTLKSDIWALGCIIYELCSKDPPFNAQTHLQLVNKIRKGDIAPLPKEYSKELNSVVKSCLATNPTYRPDTETLLNHPFIWMTRKQQEVTKLSRSLTTERDVFVEKLRRAEERIAVMEADNLTMKGDLEAQIRREWEVKARLEIDKQVESEYQKYVTILQAQFDQEVSRRVKDQMSKHVCHTPVLRELNNVPAIGDLKRDRRNHHSSTIASEETDWTNNTELTELSDLSIHSPSLSPTRPPPKKTKTPFGRSKTCFDSPADIQMGETSHVSISSLALSPRRQAGNDMMSGKNLFAQMTENKARLTIRMPEHADDNKENDFVDSDDDTFPDLPSPTRPKQHNTDPFKMLPPPASQQSGLKSKLRPGLTRQHTIATTNKLTTKPNLFPTSSSSTAAAVRASFVAAQTLPTQSIASQIPRSTTEGDLRSIRPSGAVSPVAADRRRRLSKIPSRGNLAEEVGKHERQVITIGSTSPVRRSATTSAIPPSTRTQSQPQTQLNTTMGPLTRNNVLEGAGIAGRTRVELAQARAGGRPQSTGIRLIEKDLPAVPVWDPEELGDDAMPSPFLKRDVRSIRTIR